MKKKQISWSLHRAFSSYYYYYRQGPTKNKQKEDICWNPTIPPKRRLYPVNLPINHPTPSPFPTPNNTSPNFLLKTEKKVQFKPIWLPLKTICHTWKVVEQWCQIWSILSPLFLQIIHQWDNKHKDLFSFSIKY